MVALRGAAIDAFLKRPDPAQPIVLVYGPDAGLVRERADALIASAIDDANDPFALVRLEGDELSADPARLAEEALTIPLFGGRRAIRVRAGSRNFSSAVENLADLPMKDCRVVIEAGDLKPDHALRKTCERGKGAVAIACYADDERALAGLIDDELRAANLKIAPDARGALLGSLGGDRQASRNELRKLALYAHGDGEITLQHVAAIVTDASDLRIDPIIDFTFSGQTSALETAIAKAMHAKIDPGQILMLTQRHAASLHRASVVAAGGQSISEAVKGAFFRLHFSREKHVEAALRHFSSERLFGIIEQLGVAAFEARCNSSLASAIAQRVLMAIAANARRRTSSI